MSRNLLMAVTGAVCAAALFVPAGAAQASDKPELGPCKTKVDKVKSKNKKGERQTAAEKKSAKGGNDEALTTGITIICK